MPLNDFYTYTITESNDNELKARVTINPDHDVFNGHFPEQPVTPGVILIEIARTILSEYTGKNLFFSSAKELKFMSPVLPEQNTEIDLTISYQQNDADYKVACIYTAGEKTFTKLKGIFCAS